MSTTGEILYPFTDNVWNIVRTDETVPADQWTNTVIVETMDGNPGTGGAPGSEKQGLFDFNMKTLLPIQYSHIEYLKDGYYLLSNYGGEQGTRYGIYHYGEGVTIPVEYSKVTYLGSDVFAVRNSKMLYGVLDGSGKTVLPFSYGDITGYQNGCYSVGLCDRQPAERPDRF